ncbi:hypothetical protein ABL78_5923 [Leptomonas seymouri]|uniref:RRM domain-containing protein n=1 Tax=Leptomonas seymouri TaxID=5684 RepID=A0A0N1I442_LEPSE|nr:hypothetical protein ABL78_5923 [Leptomonas seymouri]|eukprot:KPI85014.1 hypothetical protein ABL78_5923 [Leptomonas seymouri]
MQPKNGDAQCRLMYINGAPYIISPAHLQGSVQLQQVFLPWQQQQQQQQLQDTTPAGYMLVSTHNAARQAAMTLLPVAQASHAAHHGPLAPSQVLPPHSAPAVTREMLTGSPGQVWVSALANQPRIAYPDGSQLPSYRTVVSSAAASMEALQRVRVVSLLPSSMGATPTAGPSAPSAGLDSPLHPLLSVSRRRAEQCLHSLSIYQRGTARLFVGQIHYDACEDDLYQIFGVYGHVLDVKIMRSGDASAPSSIAAASSRGDVTAATDIAANTRANTASSTTTNTSTNIDSDSCNSSTDVNPSKAKNESNRVCGSPLLGLPPPSPPLSAAVIAVTSAQAVIQLKCRNGNKKNSTASPTKSNRRCNAFVTFSSMVEADTAISALHGRYVMGRDRPLQVTYCQATENISQFGYAHAVRLNKENKNNPLPFKSGTPTHR